MCCRGIPLFAAMIGASALLAGADDIKPGQKPFDDSTFVMEAASGGMFEVELGKIAESRAKNDDVRKFGQRMVDDHGKGNEQLKKAAMSAGITVPAKMNEKDQKNLDRFKNYTGENFDQDYVKDMISDHQHDIAEFTRASKEAKNPAIKEFAAKSLPLLKDHLAAAKKLKP
jgi:putative membrane protein